MAFLRYKTGLTTWYRAAAAGAERDESLLTGGGWPDILKNNDLNNVVGNPRLRLNAINGRPAVEFDGASALYSNNTLASYIGVAAGTAFAVYNVTTAATSVVANFPAIWTQKTLGGLAYGLGVNATSTGARQEVVNTDTTAGAAAVFTNITAGIWNVGIWRHGASVLSGNINDETASWAIGGSGNSASLGFPLAVGMGSNGTSSASLVYQPCKIAEMLFYNTALTTAQMAQVLNYLRAEYFSPSGPPFVSPLTRADALEQSRAIASRMLWYTRQPRMMATVRAPAYMLDADLFSNVGVATLLGPSAQGTSAPGWPNALWARQPMRVFGTEINLDNPGNVTLKLGDLRQYAANLWESANYQRASDEQRQGGAFFGRVVRAYSRDSYAWIEDPGNSAVFQVTPGVEKVGSGSPYTALPSDRVAGLLLEMPASNYLLRSSFISQLAGLTAPTAQTGASVAATSSTPVGMLFNSTVTGYCLHMVAPNPSTSADYLEIWPATASLAAFGPNIPSRFAFCCDWASTDANQLTGQPAWSLQRANDSHWYSAGTRSWASTSQIVNVGFDANYYNPMTSAFFSAYTCLRGVTFINMSSGTTTLTPRIGIPRNAAQARNLWIFHAELIGQYDATSSGTVSGYDPLWVSTRIVTDTSRSSRSADNLRYYDATSSGAGIIAPYAGTILFRFATQWSPSDFWPTTSGPGALSGVQFFLCGETSSAGSSGGVSNYWYCSYTASTSVQGAPGTISFGVAGSSGTGAATIQSAVGIGTNTIACRYCSSSGGELGLPANTMDIFFGGTKGTAFVPVVKPSVYGPFYWSNVVAASSAATRLTAGAAIWDIQFRPYVMTDAEIAAWATL